MIDKIPTHPVGDNNSDPVSPWAQEYKAVVDAREASRADSSRQSLTDRLVDGGNFLDAVNAADKLLAEHHGVTLDFAGKPKAGAQEFVSANGEKIRAASFYSALRIEGTSYGADGTAQHEAYEPTTFRTWAEINGVLGRYDFEGVSIEDADNGGKVARAILSQTVEGDHFPSRYQMVDLRSLEQFNLDNNEKDLQLRKEQQDLGQVAIIGENIRAALDVEPGSREDVMSSLQGLLSSIMNRAQNEKIKGSHGVYTEADIHNQIRRFIETGDKQSLTRSIRDEIAAYRPEDLSEALGLSESIRAGAYRAGVKEPESRVEQARQEVDEVLGSDAETDTQSNEVAKHITTQLEQVLASDLRPGQGTIDPNFRASRASSKLKDIAMEPAYRDVIGGANAKILLSVAQDMDAAVMKRSRYTHETDAAIVSAAKAARAVLAALSQR